MNILTRIYKFIFRITIFKYYRNKKKKLYREKDDLKDKNITLISSNCIAGCIYSDLGKEFISPTINCFFYGECFIKFCENLEYYLGQELEEVKYSKYKGNVPYPVGSLDGIEIHFLHYISFELAKKKWKERVNKIDKHNIRFIIADRDGFTEDIARRFSMLPGNNNLIFTPKKLNLKGTVYCYKEKKEVSDDFTLFRKYEKYIDVVDWFNISDT
jgi:uncharacterized protein (DUF1919 family)